MVFIGCTSGEVCVTPGQNHTFNPLLPMLCYMGKENDESYQNYVEKKVQEQKDRYEQQQALGIASEEIIALPGHCMATRTQTTNETYGQYIDQLPRFPAIYPLPGELVIHPMKLQVKFHKSSISGHPLVPNYFHLPDRSAHVLNGPFSKRVRTRDVSLKGEPIAQNAMSDLVSAMKRRQGQRRLGFTFPVQSPTGLELDRPVYYDYYH